MSRANGCAHLNNMGVEEGIWNTTWADRLFIFSPLIQDGDVVRNQKPLKSGKLFMTNKILVTRYIELKR